MFTLIFNDFLLHILTLPHIHGHSVLLCCRPYCKVKRSLPRITARLYNLLIGVKTLAAMLAKTLTIETNS